MRLSRTRTLAVAAAVLAVAAILLLRLAGLPGASFGLALILGVAVLSVGLGRLFGPRARRSAGRRVTAA